MSDQIHWRTFSSWAIDLIESFRGGTSDQFAINDGRRRTGAVTEAINRFEGEFVVRTGLAKIDAQTVFDMIGKGDRAQGLARFGAAKLDDVAAQRFVLEIVIEADNAMNFGARKAKRRSN